MAASSAESGSDCQIVITDEEKLNSLCSTITEQVSGLLETHGADEFLCATSFTKIFKQAMKANTIISGQPSLATPATIKSDADCGTRDPEKQVYLQTVVLPKLDALTVEVTKKRRTIPEACCRHLRQKLSAQHQSLLEQRSLADKSPAGTMPILSSTNIMAVKEEITSQASIVSTHLANFTKDADFLSSKYERLQSAKHMLEDYDNLHKTNQVPRKRKHK